MPFSKWAKSSAGVRSLRPSQRLSASPALLVIVESLLISQRAEYLQKPGRIRQQFLLVDENRQLQAARKRALHCSLQASVRSVNLPRCTIHIFSTREFRGDAESSFHNKKGGQRGLPFGGSSCSANWLPALRWLPAWVRRHAALWLRALREWPMASREEPAVQRGSRRCTPQPLHR